MLVASVRQAEAIVVSAREWVLRSADQLASVKGIGLSTIEKIAPVLSLRWCPCHGAGAQGVAASKASTRPAKAR